MSDRSILFIDGENLLVRFEAMLKEGRRQTGGTEYKEKEYIWHPNFQSIHKIRPYRILYYNAMQGSEEKIENHRRELASLVYATNTPDFKEKASVTPRVFQKGKNKTKTKSVDINLTTDLLRHAMNGSIDRAIVFSGDGDYIPVYQEVMRHGVKVTVGALSSGLNPMILTSVDFFFDLDECLFYKDE